MLRSLWIAKTGMDAQQFNLDVISNNLANSSTVGFKRVQPMFQDLMYTTLRAAGASSNAQNLLPTGLQIGAGSGLTSTERNNIQGPLVQTQNNLDVAIQGNGFFPLTTDRHKLCDRNACTATASIRRLSLKQQGRC